MAHHKLAMGYVPPLEAVQAIDDLATLAAGMHSFKFFFNKSHTPTLSITFLFFTHNKSKHLDKQYILAISMPQHLYQLECSFLFNNDTDGTILVHVPLLRDKQGLRLYKFQNLPIKDPSKLKNFDVILNPPREFLAIDQQGTLYREFSSSELQTCGNINRYYSLTST